MNSVETANQQQTMEYAAPKVHAVTPDYISYLIVACAIILMGVISVALSIFCPLTGAFKTTAFGVTEVPPIYHVGYIVMFIGGFGLIGLGQVLRMLVAIAQR